MYIFSCNNPHLPCSPPWASAHSKKPVCCSSACPYSARAPIVYNPKEDLCCAKIAKIYISDTFSGLEDLITENERRKETTGLENIKLDRLRNNVEKKYSKLYSHNKNKAIGRSERTELCTHFCYSKKWLCSAMGSNTQISHSWKKKIISWMALHKAITPQFRTDILTCQDSYWNCTWFKFGRESSQLLSCFTKEQKSQKNCFL